MADTTITAPTVIPPGLEPLANSHTADDVEADMQAAFIEVFEALLRPAERRVNTYGAPHRADFGTIERFTKADGLAMDRGTNPEAYLAQLFRAWRAHNPKRGTAFLRHYLQLLWPGLWSVAQLWQDPGKPYPSDMSEVEVPGWWLTSRIRVNLEIEDPAELARLVGSFRAVLAARFVLELTLRRQFEGGLRMACAGAQGEYQQFSGTAAA